MAKYTATIDEDTRQRILALPRRVHFASFMKMAIAVFVEELEKDLSLTPKDFEITVKGNTAFTPKNNRL
jgi:hypothetical protein